MPEFLERRFNPQSRSFLSVISLVSYVLTKVAVTVYAGGVAFKTILGIESIWGIDFFWISAVGLVVLTGIYTVLGGMKAIHVDVGDPDACAHYRFCGDPSGRFG